MLSRIGDNPCGKLSAVFHDAKELDGAYDFVENENLSIARLESAVGRATARRKHGSHVFVAIDGSSLTLTARPSGEDKGFGPIGPIQKGWKGLKVMTALSVGEDGAPIGVLAQSWWARPNVPGRPLKQCKKERMKKTPREKETRHWLEVIERSAERLDEAGVCGWFQLDREGDAWSTLLTLAEQGHRFTVRSSWDRLLDEPGPRRRYLRATLAKTKPIGRYELLISERWGRKARRAQMVVHAAEVTLLLREKMNGKKPRPLRVRVVWTHEVGTVPRGEKPLNWMLLTNAAVDSFGAARRVVDGYAMRWRIEEFHRTWKTGACDVERTQLRSRNAVIRWAMTLGVAAVRIERLKRLAREQPGEPASIELSAVEIEVLVALRKIHKRRREPDPDAMPTIGQATLWIAELGGYTGQSSGGLPGSITIGRGFERLRHGADAILALRGRME